MNSNSNNAAWNDFNDAEEQREFALIPPKTLAKVIMAIRPGGYDDASQGWTGGYATRSDKTGAVYLNAKFTILEGPFAKRVVFGLIGLYSPKGPDWTNMGRSFLRAILNSARGIHPADQTPQAQTARRIRASPIWTVSSLSSASMSKRIRTARTRMSSRPRSSLTARSTQP
jgi:hypothetical protein